MIPDVGRVVAGATEAVDGLHAEHIVQSLHADDVDLARIEELLSASHRGPRRVAPTVPVLVVSVAGEARPRVEVREDDGAEWDPLGIEPERIIDPDVELLL